MKGGEADFSGDVEESSPSSSPIDSDREELRCEDGMDLSSTIQVSLISTPGNLDYHSEEQDSDREDGAFSSQIEENNEEEHGQMEKKEEMAEVIHEVKDVWLAEWNRGGDTSEKVDGTLALTWNKTSKESWLEFHSEKPSFLHKRMKIQTEVEY